LIDDFDVSETFSSFWRAAISLSSSVRLVFNSWSFAALSGLHEVTITATMSAIKTDVFKFNFISVID
jgi:hypothetical protein